MKNYLSIIRNIYYQNRINTLSKKWQKVANKGFVDGKVLVFHHVSNEKINEIESCVCRTDVFESIINDYKNKNVLFLSIDAVSKMIENRSSEPFVSFTFDDVPDNFLTNAYPILSKYSVPFTLFLTTEYIGKEGYLTKQQIKLLLEDSLCTIGAHTLSHPHLRYISNSRYEIASSKSELESMFGIKVNYFAYPYGRQTSVSKKNIKEVRESGFLMAFSTIQAPVSELLIGNKFFLPRIVQNSL